MRFIGSVWYWFIRTLVRFGYFWLTGGFQVVGKDRVPRTGAIIVAPNHSSYLDPPAAGCALPRRLTYMAKSELFKFRPIGLLLRSLGAFPVRRGESDIDSIRTAVTLLEQGRALLVFPEGARNFGDQLLPLNRGVEVLAKKSGALVVPAAIVGTHRKWGKGKGWKLWGKVTVSFGEPFRWSDYEGKEAFATELESRILALCHEAGFAIKSADGSSPTIAAGPADAATAP